MENNEIINRNNELFAELKKYPANTKEYHKLVAEIVKNNLGLVTYIAKKYFPRNQRETALSSDDLISEGYLGLLNAVKSFDLAQSNNFLAYAWQSIKNEILRRLKRERKHKNVSSLNDNIAAESEGKSQSTKILLSTINIEEDIAQKYETQRQIAWIRENLDQLTPPEKKVFTAKYLSGEIITDVALAKKLKRSQQYVSQTKRRAIKRLRGLHYRTHCEEFTTEKKIAPEDIAEFSSEETEKTR